MDYLVLTKTGGMILGPIAEILGWILDLLFRLTSSFGVLNIGLCIILFTLVVKLIMFPMTVKQQKSSKLMAIMQPEIQAIQDKYKGKTDNESMVRMNAETRAVYEKYGTSVTGGCLQLIIQMPILFALYRVVYNIPAYVGSVKTYFMNVVYAITGISDAASLPAGAADALLQFATDNKVALTGVTNIGDLTGVSGEALANKMVDILYKLNPAQWTELGKTFGDASGVIAENAAAIEGMNSFLGINLASNPWQGAVPTIAWLIPILAGLTQWYSTKLLSAQNPAQNQEGTGAEMMKSMNIMMPLMSVFFCFTFPAAIGIYWVANSVFTVIQQIMVNSYLNRVDIDDMIKKNLEKANKKRAKKGLPPQNMNKSASETLKQMQEKNEKAEAERAKKLEKTKEQVKAANEYYQQNEPKPGSLAAKARMVEKYNEKSNK